MPPCSKQEIRSKLRSLPGWRSGKSHLSKTFTFSGFSECIAFVDLIAQRATAVDHHPDIDIRFAKATLRLSTHDEGGVTGKDFLLAADIDDVYAGFSQHLPGGSRPIG
ncbi:putative pterin-4-alpha-carbinolamine dehydratase [Planctomycetota bacterium]|nr:putative pterin-4-alpha-carbinolamine dehydratase [Planctomycetota bacterium]